MQEKIRFVELKDSTGILNIYTPYILDTTISFEYEPPSLSEFTERISNISSKYPYLVYERNSKILGFAYGSPYQERIAYLYDADLSIYLAPEAQNSVLAKNFTAAFWTCFKNRVFIMFMHALLLITNAVSIFMLPLASEILVRILKPAINLTSGWILSGWTNSCSSLTVLRVL